MERDHQVRQCAKWRHDGYRSAQRRSVPVFMRKGRRTLPRHQCEYGRRYALDCVLHTISSEEIAILGTVKVNLDPCDCCAVIRSSNLLFVFLHFTISLRWPMNSRRGACMSCQRSSVPASSADLPTDAADQHGRPHTGRWDEAQQAGLSLTEDDLRTLPSCCVLL